MRKHIPMFVLIALPLLIWPLLSSRVLGAPSPDFDGDGDVDRVDFFQFAEVFGAERGDRAYDARYDLNGDDRIEFQDFFIFSEQFGKPVPPPVGDTSAFALKWNDIPPQPWWRESAPYSCAPEEKTTSTPGCRTSAAATPFPSSAIGGTAAICAMATRGSKAARPWSGIPTALTSIPPPTRPTTPWAIGISG